MRQELMLNQKHLETSAYAMLIIMPNAAQAQRCRHKDQQIQPHQHHHKHHRHHRFLNRQSLFITMLALIFLCMFQIDLIRTAAFNDNNIVHSVDNNNIETNENYQKMSKHSMEAALAINMQRQLYLREQCHARGYGAARLEDLTELQMEHMIVDMERKFLYCYVPKVACTNWKRMLMIINGNWQNGTDALQIPGHLAHQVGMFQKFGSLTAEQRRTVLAPNWTRLMLVRHPFERLLSAYRNKLIGNTTSAHYFQTRVGRQIVRRFRATATNHSLEYGDDVSFGEFVRYLLTPEVSVTNQTYNEHWEPITRLCNPCAMNYNVIGKYETLLSDSDLALRLMGLWNMSFPRVQKPSTTRSQLHTYYDPLPRSDVRDLYNIYKEDFRLFQYGLKDVLGYEFG